MASDSSDELTISGTVIFTNDVPESPLPNPSILKVKLEDCRLSDGDAIGVAEVTIDAHEVYVKGQPLKYTMKIKNVAECPCFGTEISAVLTVGWRPEQGSDEWIRRGDYLSDTHHPAHIKDIKDAIKENKNPSVDVEIVHYT